MAEGVGVGQIDKIGEKVHAPRAISSEKLLQEHASEKAGENAFRHDTVPVGIVRERLAQVWKTAVRPISAPRCLGSLAMVLSVSTDASNRMP